MTSQLAIRGATPEDIPEMLALIHELAEYEREPESAIATAEDLLRDGFAEPKRFHALIAEWREGETAEAQAVGLALYFYNYSTWRGRAGIYVEDLFVRPMFRGRGVGKALLRRVAEIAVAEGCARLEWSVLNWNTPAIDFYRALGAEAMSEWTIMRVAGDALVKLGTPRTG